MKPIDRSSVNQEQYSAPEFPKSGFNLSHKKYSSWILGRIHASGFQECMPGDKISGQNKGNFTFNRIVTPMITDVEVGQYNMFIPYRALDTTFMEAFAPNKNNSMSKGWNAPTFSLQDVITNILAAITTEDTSTFGTSQFIKDLENFHSKITTYRNSTLSYYIATEFGSSVTVNEFLYTGWSIHDGLFEWITNKYVLSSGIRTALQKVYFDDVLPDLVEYARSRAGSPSNPLSGSMKVCDVFALFWDALLTPLIGRYSYLAELGYNYVRPRDIYSMTHDDYFQLPANERVWGYFDQTQQNEYALRAMYAIWYEHFRNVDLEPVSSDLPKWREFGSNSIIDDIYKPWVYFVYRMRSWYKDMFTTAQIDDLSRHVFAPVYASSSGNIEGHGYAVNNHFANTDNDSASAFDAGSKPALYNLSWYDQLTEQQVYIDCPVPANINDVLSASDLQTVDVYGLDLNSLRQSQMLERYLKRNYLFGDEYQDRMLAHYNSRVSDLRINRPEILSRSLNTINQGQEIANMSNGISNAGDRTATATASADGDMFTTYCEEFGILINIITFMPLASYDGICPQRLLYKVADYPLPEFAANNEEFGRIREISDTGVLELDGNDPLDIRSYMFGRYPAYHAWRSRVDQIGGMFLNELQDATFRRYWGTGSSNLPKLNYQFLHCRPNLEMFANTVRYDTQVYGDVVHECYVERVLPTPVEVI